ncbi:phosphotransferase [Alteromonas pelagimontana]|uniref:Phosphotransferase n=1 Tax=Alteromonas pelagimontana TaxID=1858656 RepID=A0A6M4M8R2_9ALTE|nr:fructosamine kinase family protein [Alteromonas pelagimontana]QJR79527.1 phosphotransferase [Alteromonas pelagimontana]
MWHFICEHISEATSALFVCQHRTRVSGGDTHACYIIRDDHRRFFVKVCPLQTHAKLCFEVEGLEAIGATKTLLTPNIICHGIVENHSHQTEFLVLNHVKFIDGQPEDWRLLGQQVATLHQQPAAGQHGWHQNNVIGRSIQTNRQQQNWAAFFAEQRIGSMLERLARVVPPFTNIDALVTQVVGFLKDHNPPASLLHGDLWHGNVGFCKRGPIVYDPAVYYGDRETDIAMTTLFGRFPSTFYLGYQEQWPLPEDYKERMSLYQLYHLLNHALIFGDHYLSSAKSAIIAFQQHASR